MELNQAIALLQNPAIIKNDKQVWADLGSGEGLFSRALATLLPQGSTIYAVDQNKSALQRIKQQERVVIKPTYANFVKDDLPSHDLNGILMANALHFVEDKTSLIKKLAGYCRKDHCFLIVEYDTDTPNPWVPYPLGFGSLQQFFHQCGYTSVDKIHEVPSLYGRSKIYSAIIKY
jgi:ubiquinone/menaquinone biosynthesis C-methylase UbiE